MRTATRSTHPLSTLLRAATYLLLCLLPVHAMLHAAEPPATRPNIIFIMADDLGYGDLVCYGQKHIQTPHIDRLAAEGIKFTDCYSGSAVCAPARCVLMTGRHSGHARIRGNAAAVGGFGPQRRVPLLAEDVTVAEVLKTVGYTTGVIGKWGLGEPDTSGIPNRQGFDFWFGYLNQSHAHGYYPEFLWRNETADPLHGNFAGREGQYSHDLCTREALAFIERSHADPFFLYLPYTIPHGKLQVPDLGPYADKDWPEALQKYAAMITRLDTDVGKIMALLKKLKIDNRTIVFFTSDNGGEASYVGGSKFFNSWGPFRGTKSTLYEGGIRVPMVVRFPGHISPLSVSDQVWSFCDFLPTAAELAGVKPPDDIDGISMLPVLLGRPQKSHEMVYWEYGKWQAVRKGHWKAVRRGEQPFELYDLRSDPGEENNLAAAHPDLIADIESYVQTARTESEFWPRTK